MTKCPSCDADVIIGEKTEESEIITCSDCGTELEVTGKDSVKPAPQEEEDWGE